MAALKVHKEICFVWKGILQQLFFSIPSLGDWEWRSFNYECQAKVSISCRWKDIRMNCESHVCMLYIDIQHKKYSGSQTCIKMISWYIVVVSLQAREWISCSMVSIRLVCWKEDIMLHSGSKTCMLKRAYHSGSQVCMLEIVFHAACWAKISIYDWVYKPWDQQGGGSNIRFDLHCNVIHCQCLDVRV